MEFANTDIAIVMPVRKETTYFRAALASALAQTVPVRIVVHDASPKPAGFREIIEEMTGPIGTRVEYHHFTDGIGIGGDWNRAMSLPGTTWVSPLHQDDILLPNGIELLIKARTAKPDRALYFGLDDAIDETGKVVVDKRALADQRVIDIPPADYVQRNQFCAAGALINWKTAQALGGFALNLQMTVDWDMWVRLTLHAGAARINEITAQFREYFDPQRGTSVQEITGGKLLKTGVQLKKNIARMKAAFPGYEPTPDAGSYLYDMAGADLRAKGFQLSKKGRLVCFYYIHARQLSLHPGNKRLAYATAVYFAQLYTLYSRIRPYRLVLRRVVAKVTGPGDR